MPVQTQEMMRQVFEGRSVRELALVSNVHLRRRLSARTDAEAGSTWFQPGQPSNHSVGDSAKARASFVTSLSTQG